MHELGKAGSGEDAPTSDSPVPTRDTKARLTDSHHRFSAPPSDPAHSHSPARPAALGQRRCLSVPAHVARPWLVPPGHPQSVRVRRLPERQLHDRSARYPGSRHTWRCCSDGRHGRERGVRSGCRCWDWRDGRGRQPGPRADGDREEVCPGARGPSGQSRSRCVRARKAAR